MAALDFSSQDLEADLAESNVDSLVDEKGLGKRRQDGLYEVADYNDKDGDDEEDSILASLTASNLSTKSQDQKAQVSTLSSFFSKISTGAGFASKTLTSEDLKPVLNTMREHLMNKNVARDIADQICDSVGQSLIGKKTSGFGDGGVKAEVRRSLEESLTRILTSKTSTDILLDISRKRKSAQAGSGINEKPRAPYVITFVGVNGVGKSTNLSKVAFWLLQNKLRVLIAACDTFRSGAVEQLRVHVRNLSKLKVLQDAESSGQAPIELYERGYGKDAAGIAKDAIEFGECLTPGWTRSMLTKYNIDLVPSRCKRLRCSTH
jgi:signal recognition particle receptor subunit alpha